MSKLGRSGNPQNKEKTAQNERCVTVNRRPAHVERPPHPPDRGRCESRSESARRGHADEMLTRQIQCQSSEVAQHAPSRTPMLLPPARRAEDTHALARSEGS